MLFCVTHSSKRHPVLMLTYYRKVLIKSTKRFKLFHLYTCGSFIHFFNSTSLITNQCNIDGHIASIRLTDVRVKGRSPKDKRLTHGSKPLPFWQGHFYCDRHSHACKLPKGLRSEPRTCPSGTGCQ